METTIVNDPWLKPKGLSQARQRRGLRDVRLPDTHRRYPKPQPLHPCSRALYTSPHPRQHPARSRASRCLASPIPAARCAKRGWAGV